MSEHSNLPDRQMLVDELNDLLHDGAEIEALLQRKILLNLETVRSRVEPPKSPDDERALAYCLKDLLQECCWALSGWKKYAAQASFGLLQGSGALSLGKRDDLAGSKKVSDGKPDGITGHRYRVRELQENGERKPSHRDKIIRDLADQIYEREIEALSLKRRPPPPPEVEADVHGYICLSTERIYSISDDDPRFHTEDRISLIETTRTGVTQFQSWYKWSGHGRESDPVALSNGHSISQTTNRNYDWKYYYVDLGGPQRIGSRVKIHTKQNFLDEHEQFDNHYSLMISRTQHWQTGVLRVRLPLRLLPREEDIEFLTYDTLDHTASPIKREPGRIQGPAREIFWALPHPLKVEHRYEIRWTYPHRGGIYQIA
jgi:hypothetical protein